MPTFLATIGGRIWSYLAAIGAFLALIGTVWLRGRAAGTQAARVRQMEQAAKQRDTRDEIDRAVARTDDPAGELLRDWRRPD